ncbi:MAG: hypothetical protein JKY56_27875 [Kofleriaceae bacterium]|nr:hypothetical protein [Kofleriaceae bacterium]
MPTLRLLSLLLLSFLLAAVAGCRTSKTAKKIAGFADQVCECKDAECAKGVQETYLTWWTDHQRARGSEEDHKEVEGSMERFAKCYRELVGKEKSTIVPVVPRIDLSPPTQKPLVPTPSAEVKEETATPDSAELPATKVAPPATKVDPGKPATKATKSAPASQPPG